MQLLQLILIVNNNNESMKYDTRQINQSKLNKEDILIEFYNGLKDKM